LTPAPTPSALPPDRPTLPAAVPRQPSSLFFYFVAAALGLSFSGVLLLLAWSNAVETENRAFAFEALAVDDSARMGLRAAHEATESMASFLGATGEATAAAAFESLSTDLMSRNEFVTALAVYRRDPAADARYLLHRHRVREALALPPTLAVDSEQQYSADLRSALETGSVVPLVLPDGDAAGGAYWLLRPVPAGDGRARNEFLVLTRIDPIRLLGNFVSDADLMLQLFLESEGVGGRRLLYRKDASAGRRPWLVAALQESSQVRFERYSVRLLIDRSLYWQDLDKALLFTAAILGVGVTLLLVALARAKDLQARELAARNRVIEEQVRRQTQELAEARDQALAASRVKSDFLASMSHEIRTPLNAIIGMAELLSETRLSADQARYVGIFRNAGEALLSLVNDILDLSKIEAGQLVLEHIDFDLGELVERSADIYALQTAGKGLELTVQIDPRVGGRARGDPTRLRQIVLNLIGNAIKFTERGAIDVTVAPATRRAGSGGVRISVSDTGIGIPGDKQQEIFASFSQVDSSTTRKYGGTGLGLTISRKLVELMGGEIWVESREREGSRFHLEVPLECAPETTEAAAGPAAGCALVVGGGARAGEVLGGLLEGSVARVIRAADAAAARRALADDPSPDLIFCDAGLSHADGIELAGELAVASPRSRVVVLLDSTQLGADLERVRRIERSAFLVKPLKRREVRAVLGAPATVPAATPEVLESREAPPARARLLLVEDNPDNRLLIRSYLKREPYLVDEAENGALAVAACAAQRYDLVLMDVQMPVMDGHAATRAIRDRERAEGLPPVPVIALSAHAIKEDMERSLEAGCTAHLTKPIKKQVLLAALADHLGHDEPRQSGAGP
jgi:signal transduction histidine kinase/CheY-like chemotaxis protein